MAAAIAATMAGAIRIAIGLATGGIGTAPIPRDQYPYPDRYPYPDSRYPYPDRYPGEPGGCSVPFDNGYTDGLDKGREDARDNDRYDPARHSRYRSADRGYDRQGSREEYRDIYREGFRAGYDHRFAMPAGTAAISGTAGIGSPGRSEPSASRRRRGVPSSRYRRVATLER